MRARSARSAALLALAAALLAGCTEGDTARPTSLASTPSSTPTALEPPTPTASATKVPTTARAVYYVMDAGPAGPRLYREFRRRPEGADPVRDAVELMLGRAARDPDYTSLWPEGTVVRDVQVEGDRAVVDLSARAAEGSAGAAFEAASLQQLVHTVTAAEPAVRSVQLLIEGEVRETLWGHVDISQPLERAAQVDVLGPVWLLTPQQGDRLARGDDFGGSASVYEATVSWEWRRDGAVVAEGFSTADQAAPSRGEWSATVDVPPGDYELRAFSSSAQDGSPLFVDSKRVTVEE